MGPKRSGGRGGGAGGDSKRRQTSAAQQSKENENLPPTRKYPLISDLSLLTAYLRDIEDGAFITKGTQTAQGTRPRHLLDSLKVKPIEKWADTAELYPWRKPENEDDCTDFYNQVIQALETDLKNLCRQLPPPTSKKDRDYYEVLTDSSQSEPDNPRQIDRHPAVKCLRNVKRQLVRDEQFKFLTGRSLAIVASGGNTQAVTQDLAKTVRSDLHTTKMRKLKYKTAKSRIASTQPDIPPPSFLNQLQPILAAEATATAQAHPPKTPTFHDQILPTPAEQILYLANLNQINGRPMGKTYAAMQFKHAFPFLLLAIGHRGLQSIGLPKLQRVKKDKLVTDGVVRGEIEDSDEEEIDFQTQNFTEYGPDNTMVRIGAGYGRLANVFDVNRRRLMDKEIECKDTDKSLPLAFASSEEDDQMYIDRQQKYRHRFRAFRDTHSTPEQKVCASANSDVSKGDALPNTDASPSGRRKRGTAAQSAGKKKVKVTAAVEAYDKSVQLADSLGIKEEVWRSFRLKPRVRRMDTYRMDLDAKSRRPLGFHAIGKDVTGRELQLVGIDTSEMKRRFGLTRLYQEQLSGGVCERVAKRRTFAAVIGADGVRIYRAGQVQLMLSESPEEALQEMLWNFYWNKGRYGEHEAHVIKKSMRYRNLSDNNVAFWKDDVERYQKLRERAVEWQSHRQLRYLKMRPGLYRHRKEIDLMANPDFNYEYAADDEEDEEEEETDVAEDQDKDDEVKVKVTKSEKFMNLDEAKAEARKSKLRAEKIERKNPIKRFKVNITSPASTWNGSRNSLRTNIANRYRYTLNDMQESYSRRFRSYYKQIRAQMAERIQYENQWTSTASRRAAVTNPSSTTKTEEPQ